MAEYTIQDYFDDNLDEIGDLNFSACPVPPVFDISR